jgi:ATP-dependent DNA ligase
MNTETMFRPLRPSLGEEISCKRLIAYDLLALNGEDLRRMPLHERRTRLESPLSGNDALWFSSGGVLA